MRLTKEQMRRYEATRDRLLGFTNENLASCIDFTPPISCFEDVTKGMRIALDLWQDASMIDLFLKRFDGEPAGIDLKAVEMWRHVLRGPFYVKACSGGTAELLYEDTLFEVQSISRDWDDLIPYRPDVVYTTLVPFDGVIINDGFLLHHQCAVMGPGASRLSADFKRAKKRGAIADADSFMRAADRLNARRRVGMMEINNAVVWMSFVDGINDITAGSCFPYEIPRNELPPELRGRRIVHTETGLIAC